MMVRFKDLTGRRQDDSMQPNEPRNPEETVFNLDRTFTFACHDSLPCFTQCCRDVNIYLTPYDILRLRRALGISASDVLIKYTRSLIAEPAGIPFFQLLMDPGTLRCKLVTEDGCSVYENRPWACRMYPLDPTGRPGEYRAIVGKERCLGLREAATWNVGLWLDNQGIDGSYEEMDKAFQSIMSMDFRPAAHLGEEIGKLIYLAYDIDRFAAMIQEDRFRSTFEVDDKTLREALENDEALLRLALDFIRSRLEDLL